MDHPRHPHQHHRHLPDRSSASLLGASARSRLLIVAPAIIVIWLAVLWAMAGVA